MPSYKAKLNSLKEQVLTTQLFLEAEIQAKKQLQEQLLSIQDEIQGNQQFQSMECSICLNKIYNNNNCLITECNHCYHTSCLIKNVLNKNYDCPLCRKNYFDVSSFDVSRNYITVNEDDDSISYNSVTEEELFFPYRPSWGARFLEQAGLLEPAVAATVSSCSDEE